MDDLDIKHASDVPNVLIDRHAINMVKSSTFLVVVINSFLNWNDHISLVNSKISKAIGILRYLKTSCLVTF